MLPFFGSLKSLHSPLILGSLEPSLWHAADDDVTHKIADNKIIPFLHRGGRCWDKQSAVSTVSPCPHSILTPFYLYETCQLRLILLPHIYPFPFLKESGKFHQTQDFFIFFLFTMRTEELLQVYFFYSVWSSDSALGGINRNHQRAACVRVSIQETLMSFDRCALRDQAWTIYFLFL